MGQWIEGSLSERLFGIDFIRIQGKMFAVTNSWEALPSPITKT
jgi:hypothetical protein